MERLEDAESIELRPYQQELVEAACRGVNTIICAPTGSGKTVVAAYIILEHFRVMKATNKPSRACFSCCYYYYGKFCSIFISKGVVPLNHIDLNFIDTMYMF